MEGHLLCNGVFCLGSLFHAATQSLHRGRPGQNMKDHPLSHGARQADWWMGWGKTGREIQKTIWSMRDRSKRGGWGAVLRGKTGSDLCIWWVKRAVINPAEWSVRVVFVCLIVWRLCPCVRRQVRQDPDRKRQPEDTSAKDNLRCSGDPHKWGPDDILSVSELERLKRNSHSTGLKFNPRGQRLEREKSGNMGSNSDRWEQSGQPAGGGYAVRRRQTHSARAEQSWEDSKNAGNTMEATKEDSKSKSK